MKKSKKYLIGGIIIFATITFGIFIVFRPQSQEAPNNRDGTAPVLADIPTPNGWYAHRINSGNIIFTKKADLPSAPNTEALAYGEQINVSAVPVSGSLQDWINLNVGDDVLAPSKTSSTINNHEVLKAEVNGEAGKTLNFVVFEGNIAYVFFLYPAEIYSASTKQYTPNTPDTQVIQDMVNAFANSK